MKRMLASCLLILLLIPTAFAQGIGMVYDLLSGTDSDWGESPLGCAVADAMVAQTGADIAVLPARAIRGNLRGGQVTESELLRVVDDEMQLAIAETDLETLELLLEDGVAHLRLTEAERLDKSGIEATRFPQISGFRMEIDASGPVGDRIWNIFLPEQAPQKLRLCSDQAWFEALGIPYEPLYISPARLLSDYIAGGGLENPVDTGRIRMLGTADDAIMEGIPPFALAIVLGIVFVFAACYVRINGRPPSRRHGTR